MEIIDVSLGCESEEDLKGLVESLQNLVSCEFALCALAGAGYRSAEPHRIVNVSYPISWLETYISEQLDRIDPIVAEHRDCSGLQYWSDAFHKHPESRQFVSSAAAHGLKMGYSYGLRTPDGDAASLFSFGGRSMPRLRRTSDILHHLIPHFHEAFVRIAAPKENERQDVDPKLSRREKEVLNWVKMGKTTWEISVILSVSQRTVKFHIQNILQKVHADTRAQAVAIGLERGLINLD